MRRRDLLYLFGGTVIVWAFNARAQQNSMPVIGFLTIGSFDQGKRFEAGFRQGLRESSYIEGQNVRIEHRSAEGKPERLPALVAELVALKVDVIVAAGGTLSALAAKQATTTIPIVFTGVGDPVGEGLVTSLARPGGNITGLSEVAPELTGNGI